MFPIIDYGDIIYQNTSESHLHPLNVVYNSICRFVLRCPYMIHHCVMYDTLNWLSPQARRHLHWLLFIFKCIYFNYPPYLRQLLEPYTSRYPLRHTQQPYFTIPRTSKEIGRRAFQFKAPSDWNNLPVSLRSVTSFNIFKASLLADLKPSCTCY